MEIVELNVSLQQHFLGLYQSVVNLVVLVSIPNLSLENSKTRQMVFLSRLGAVKCKTNAEGTLSSCWRPIILNKLQDVQKNCMYIVYPLKRSPHVYSERPYQIGELFLSHPVVAYRLHLNFKYCFIYSLQSTKCCSVS